MYIELTWLYLYQKLYHQQQNSHYISTVVHYGSKNEAEASEEETRGELKEISISHHIKSSKGLHCMTREMQIKLAFKPAQPPCPAKSTDSQHNFRIAISNPCYPRLIILPSKMVELLTKASLGVQTSTYTPLLSLSLNSYLLSAGF